MNDFKKILVLAPHTDDGELGCGGSIAKWVREGHEVHYAAFAYPKGTEPHILQSELEEAMNVLGVKNVTIGRFETRMFPTDRQMILDYMIQLGYQIKPDLVLIPSRFDQHQDHQTICQEAIRAFKQCSILGYEEPWNNLEFKTDVFNILTEADLNKKTEALEHWQSQHERFFFSNDFIKSLARTRGVQISTDYAEAFEVIRWII
jgi:LmbE family N-acetylglucosaminyl deacetylase